MRDCIYVNDARRYAERKVMESFGFELELLYARILNGFVNPPGRDCGRDIEFPDPTCSGRTVGVQVKASYHIDEILHFLAVALRGAMHHGRTWTNFCVGEPPPGPDLSARLVILGSFEQYGAWIEFSDQRRLDILGTFQRARQTFPQDKVQKVFLNHSAGPVLVG